MILTKTILQIYTIVCTLGARYVNSLLGVNNLARNMSFHTKVHKLLSGDEKYKNRMDDLLTFDYILSYRLEGMTMATNYKNFLSLDYLDCAICSIEA